MKRVRLAGSIGVVGAVVGVLLAVLPSAGAANKSLQGVVLARSAVRPGRIVEEGHRVGPRSSPASASPSARSVSRAW